MKLKIWNEIHSNWLFVEESNDNGIIFLQKHGWLPVDDEEIIPDKQEIITHKPTRRRRTAIGED